MRQPWVRKTEEEWSVVYIGVGTGLDMTGWNHDYLYDSNHFMSCHRDCVNRDTVNQRHLIVLD